MSVVSSVLKMAGKSVLSKGGKTALSIHGAVFAGDMAMNVSSGDDIGKAALKAGASGLLAASNPWLFGALTVGSMATEAGWGINKWAMQKQKWWSSQYAYNNEVGGNYVDTQRAMTMRQAAVQAIQGSKMNARSALGGEAKILNPYATRRY